MSYTYTPVIKDPWEIDTTQLRHRYFVQQASDGHLVAGTVHQGLRPPTGRWLELGNIYRKLPQRYFVQQTSFNTLVPGLLMQADEWPGPNWKDVYSQTHFHFFNFGTLYAATDISGEYTLVTNTAFITNVVTPALDQLYPGRNPLAPITINLYYYRGSFVPPDLAPDQLTPFGSGNLDLGYHLTGPDTYADSFETTTTDPANITIKSTAANGLYSIVLGVTNDEGDIIDYIVLSKILSKTLAG